MSLTSALQVCLLFSKRKMKFSVCLLTRGALKKKAAVQGLNCIYDAWCVSLSKYLIIAILLLCM